MAVAGVHVPRAERLSSRPGSTVRTLPAVISLALVALSCAACGRVNFDARADALDAVAPDACAMFGPFSTPQRVANVNAIGQGMDDWLPSISADDLSLFFQSYRASPGTPDIWMATRATPTDDFSAPTLLNDVSSATMDWSPRVTADELMMVFTSDRPGGPGGLDVWQATRASKTMPFGTPTLVGSTDSFLPVSSPSGEESLWLSTDGLRIVVSTLRNATADLIYAERPDRTSPFGPVQLLAGVNAGAAADVSPSLSSDERELFFSSNRAGGLGRYDIWRAVRPARDQPFGTPAQVPELSSTGDDYGPYLSADGTRIYLAYNADVSGAGDGDIYMATRSCQ